MIETAELERRCFFLSRRLDAGASDEIELLRIGRVLKGMHEHLRRAMRMHVKQQGYLSRTEGAEYALETMEIELRAVLLDYARLDKSQIRAHLMRAVDRVHEPLSIIG